MARSGALQHFDEGGIVGAIGGALGNLAKKGEEFALGSLLRLADPVIKAIRSGISQLPDVPGGVFRALPTKALDGILSFIKDRDIAPVLAGGGGGSLGTGGWAVDKIINLAKASKIPFRVTSSYRPGDPLYHGSGRAVDFGGFNQDKFAQYWLTMQGALLELIHRSNTRDYGVSNGRTYAKGSNNQLLNEHRNHVHVAMNGNANPYSSPPGSSVGGGSTTGMAPGAIRAANSLPGNARGWLATAAGRTGVTGWQMPLQALAWRESGGNPRARSFSSNGPLGYAIGLLQLLSSTFAAYRDSRLPNDRNDPVANSVAGIQYIRARYGTIYRVGHAINERPDPGGYDNGGWLRPGWNWNGTGEGELALSKPQSRALEKGIELATTGRAGIHIENLNVYVSGGASKQDATRIAKEIRDELVNIAGRNGGRGGLTKNS
jgi:hypothetical protein